MKIYKKNVVGVVKDTKGKKKNNFIVFLIEILFNIFPRVPASETLRFPCPFLGALLSWERLQIK